MRAITEMHRSFDELVFSDPSAVPTAEDMWEVTRVLEAHAKVKEEQDDPVASVSSLFYTEPEGDIVPQIASEGNTISQSKPESDSVPQVTPEQAAEADIPDTGYSSTEPTDLSVCNQVQVP